MRYATLAATLLFAIAGPPEGGHYLAVVEAAQQKPALKAPTEADWAAIAKLPDFTGVWEVTFGPPGGRGAGAGRGRAGGPPAGPQLTPAYAEKRRANLAKAAEDSQTANCMPPGMTGIIGQP